MKFRKNSQSKHISQSGCPVHKIIDFTGWIRHNNINMISTGIFQVTKRF